VILFLLRVRRTLGATVAILAFLVFAGATYQGVATALERHRYQRPGGLVDAGGHQLHIHCSGQGSPVVILEAALGSMSAEWGWIQPEVAKVTRVCSYDRAGLGWSEAGDGSFEPSRVPEELRVLLDRANEKGPVVLVGHEGGALFARMYAARFAGDTAALVLIDDPTDARASVAPTLARAWPWLARVGLLRLSDRLSAQARGLPEGDGDAMRAFLNRPDHLTRAAMELSALDDIEGMVPAVSPTVKVPATPVSIGTHSQPAMIVSRADAARVAEAISATVAQVRALESSTSSDR
jgi:pimeloyl-ACP methyl ester carboxylesterase